MESLEAEENCRKEKLQKLIDKVGTKDFDIYSHVPYDGDCLFHSILQLLPGFSDQSTTLRSQLVHFLESDNCSPDLKMVLNDELLASVRQPYRDVHDDVVVQGLAELTKTEIHVLSLDPDNGAFSENTYRPPGQAVANRISIGHIVDKHFVPLRKRIKMKRSKQLTLFDALPPAKTARPTASDSDAKKDASVHPVSAIVDGKQEPKTVEEDVKFAKVSQSQTSAAEVIDSTTGVDIADFVGKSSAARFSHETKLKLVKNRVPRREIVMPSREYKDSKRASGVYTRHCKHEWFSMFDFACYSEREKGIFCLPCVLFPAETAHGGAKKAFILISKPLTNWKDAVADLKQHEKLEYHQDSAVKLAAFCKNMENPASRIDSVLSSVSQQRIQHNRNIISSIVKCIELCGRQGIALRGHRDDATNEENELNQGKLKAVIDFCISSGDKVLEEHLASCGKNASYISKTSQNDLLECMGDVIREAIVKEVKESHYYAILADEVTDVSGWEQLGVALRYVKDGKAQEKLIAFVACERVRGEDICKSLLATLVESGLDPKSCRAQGYDGASNMSAKFNGCQVLFREAAPLAGYFHCGSHQLNLVLSKSASLPIIHSMVCNMKSLGIFFHYSPKRQRALEKAIKNVNKEKDDPILQQKFKLLCETRWVERHTAFEDMLDLYEPLVICLESISANTDKDWDWDAKSVVEANGLLRSITSSEFIAAFHTNLHFIAYTKPLSIKLQSASKDILSAYQEVHEVKELLAEERQAADEAFKPVYKKMLSMAELAGTAVDGEVPTPRRCGKQTLRNNVTSENPQEYWRRTAFVPFLDHLMTEFGERFTEMSSAAVQGLFLLPANLDNLSAEQEEAIKSRFLPDLPEPHTFHEELKRWRKKWELKAKAEVDLPANIVDALLEANPISFPNIQRILTILLVIPVTTASVERSNSALSYVKTKLRSTMRNSRLNDLMLLYIHKNIKLDVTAVIDRFSRKKPRRVMLVNALTE